MPDAAFGGDDHLIPDGCQCFADQFLVIADAAVCVFTEVAFSCIKEGIAHICGFTNGFDSCGAVRCNAVGM